MNILDISFNVLDRIILQKTNYALVSIIKNVIKNMKQKIMKTPSEMIMIYMTKDIYLEAISEEKFFPQLVLVSNSKLFLCNNRNSNYGLLESNKIEHTSSQFDFFSKVIFLFSYQSLENVKQIVGCYKLRCYILLFTKLSQLFKTDSIFLPVIFKR